MKTLQHLLDGNRQWAEKMKQSSPDFFVELAKRQKPEYLWIGCSDSRVPAVEIVGLSAGDLFVHRNIANMVIHTDLNCLSVIQYAVEVLKIRHIIVCGHYGCGGIKAAIEKKAHGLIDNWLRHIKDIYRYYHAQIDAIESAKERFDLLCELNVIEQVSNVCHTTIVQNAWKAGQELTVHGWMYNLEDGLVRDMDIYTSDPEKIFHAHRLA